MSIRSKGDCQSIAIRGLRPPALLCRRPGATFDGRSCRFHCEPPACALTRSRGRNDAEEFHSVRRRYGRLAPLTDNATLCVPCTRAARSSFPPPAPLNPAAVIAAIPRCLRCVRMSISLGASRAEHSRRGALSHPGFAHNAAPRECIAALECKGEGRARPPSRVYRVPLDGTAVG